MSTCSDLLPHKFESISELDWKLGKSRYFCASCQKYFSDPIHGDRNLTIDDIRQEVAAMDWPEFLE